MLKFSTFFSLLVPKEIDFILIIKDIFLSGQNTVTTVLPQKNILKKNSAGVGKTLELTVTTDQMVMMAVVWRMGITVTRMIPRL